MSSIRVAAVQAEPVWLDIEGTVDKTVKLIEEAAGKGAQLVAFPETWVPGYPVFLWTVPVPEQMPYVGRYHENSMTVSGDHMRRIREAARKSRITVSIGRAVWWREQGRKTTTTSRSCARSARSARATS